MAGIRSLGAYTPKFRLGRETAGWTYPGEADIGITHNLGGRPGSFTASVAVFGRPG